MAVYNSDGTINAGPSDGLGAYTRDGCLAIKISLPNLPTPAVTMPPPAALDGKLGTSNRYALEDHTHQVKVQRAVIVTDTDGSATMTFARAFNSPPSVAALANSSSSVITLQITAKSNTSVTIQARQARTLPATLTLLSQLLNFNIFQDPAAGIQIDVFAAEVTQ